MPVKPYIVLACAVLALPLVPQTAQARMSIYKAEQLAKEKIVRVYEEPYKLASGAHVIYTQCATDLAITPAQQDFLKQRHEALAKGYLAAFDEAFTDKLNNPSDDVISKDYVRYLGDLQKAATSKMSAALATSKKGCNDKSILNIVKYYDAIQAAEASGKKVPLVAEVKKKKKQ